MGKLVKPTVTKCCEIPKGWGKEMIITNQQQRSKSKWTLFDGMKVRGWPTHTIVRGNCVMCNDEVIGKPVGEMVKFKETM